MLTSPSEAVREEPSSCRSLNSTSRIRQVLGRTWGLNETCRARGKLVLFDRAQSSSICYIYDAAWAERIHSILITSLLCSAARRSQAVEKILIMPRFEFLLFSWGGNERTSDTKENSFKNTLLILTVCSVPSIGRNRWVFRDLHFLSRITLLYNKNNNLTYNNNIVFNKVSR